MLTMTHCLRVGVMACALIFVTEEVYAEAKVVASIAPVHSLVSMVTDGVSEPGLIIRPGASPHSYAIKPSEAQALDQADIVFWVSKNLETWMTKAIETLASNARVVELGSAEEVTKFGVREGGEWALHDHHGDEVSDRQADAHNLGQYDPHLWLDPDNAIVWLQLIASELATIDPEYAAIYRANAGDAALRLMKMAASIEKDLAPIKDEPFIVFHDAYQYFERRFGLAVVGSVSLSDADRPGALRLAEIRRHIQESGAVCAFAEPQFEPKLLNIVIDGTDVARGLLDPMGADLEPGPSHYPALMEQLADSLTGCLS